MGSVGFVLATIALFISLGGTGYALTQTNASQPPDAGVRSAAVPAWHSLTLTGGWVSGGYGSSHAGYYKDAGHVVHLRGSAKSGDTSMVAFRLPPGARPGHTLWLPVYAYDGSAGALEIDANGKAYFFDANSNVNVTGYASLDGISFRVP
jgi:hypothetical protein